MRPSAATRGNEGTRPPAPPPPGKIVFKNPNFVEKGTLIKKKNKKSGTKLKKWEQNLTIRNTDRNYVSVVPFSRVLYLLS